MGRLFDLVGTRDQIDFELAFPVSVLRLEHEGQGTPKYFTEDDEACNIYIKSPDRTDRHYRRLSIIRLKWIIPSTRR